MRPLLHLATLAALSPFAAGAQTPTLQQPSSPVLSLPIELVKATPFAPSGIRYERAGLLPREFRVASTLSMSNATWAPFREGTTISKTVNGKTVTSGNLSTSAMGIGAACGSRMAWVRGFLQFRATDPSGTLYVSNIRGDSACVSLGS